MKKLLLAVMLVSAYAAVAATRTWSGGTGSVEDPAQWGGTLPGIGDTANITAKGDDVVIYPTTKPHTNFYAVSAKAPAGKTLTFSGVGSEVVTPTMASDTYVQEPYKLSSAEQLLFDLQAWWGDSAKQKTTGPFEFSDFSYRIIGSTTEPAIHFDRGTYVFDPADSKTRKHWFFPKVTADERHYSINYHAGSSASLATILYGIHPKHAVIRFDGGTHCQRADAASGLNEFSYDGGATDIAGREARFEVVGAGTSFTVESESKVGHNNFPNRTFTFLAADGGVLTFKESMTAKAAGTHVFMATNGGTLAVSTCYFAAGGTDAGAGQVKIVTDAATFASLGGVMQIGGSTAGGTAKAAFTNSLVTLSNRWEVGAYADILVKGGRLESTSDAPIYFNGGDFRTDGAELDVHGDISLQGGKLTLKDSCGFLANMVLGNAVGTASELTIDGGAITNFGTFAVGQKGTGTLNVSGDDTEVFYNTQSSAYFGNENGSVGNLNVSGGKLTIGATGNENLKHYFTSQKTSACSVRITGGETIVRANISVPRGTFDYLQSGGTFKTTNLTMGDFDGGSGNTMTFKMTGGTATVNGAFVVTQSDAYKGSVTLDGGTLAVKSLASGNFCGWNGKDGTATLSANGGALKALAASTAFLRRFDSAVLGADGLVIDTDYDITVEQAFTAAEGVTGKLIKRGTGTLTLTRAVPVNIEVVVEEGLVVFGANSTIAALTLGTETSAGGVGFAADVALQVKGEVSVLHDGSPDDFTFTRDPDTGVTTVAVDGSPARTLEIRLDAGMSNATENVRFGSKDTLAAVVAKDAKLSLDGAYARGAFVKRGEGVATLTGADNTFISGVTLEAGLLGATTLAALGFDFAVAPSFVQKGGTVELGGGGDFPAAVTVDAASKTAAVVVKNDADVTVKKAFTLTNGALFKRGAGTLRFETPATLAVDNGVNPISRTVLSFDDNGAVPTTGYAGFNVVEGEVVLADKTYNIDKCGYVGLRLDKAPASTPTLTFTNATVSLNGSGANMFFVGSCVTATDPSQRFALNILDSEVTGSTPLCIGGYDGCAATSPTSRVDVVMRNSSITASYGVWLNENVSGGKTYWTVDNSKFYGKQNSRTLGYSAVEFTNGSVYASEASLDFAPYPETKNDSNADGGYMRFNKGTHAYLDRIGGKGAFFKAKLCFNGGTWHSGLLPKAQCVSGYLLSGVRVIFEEGGAIWPVTSDTCRNTIKIEGDGGFVKTGAGALFFDTQSTWETWAGATKPGETKLTAAQGQKTWCFTGEADIREGKVSIAADAADEGVKARVASNATLELKSGCTLEGAALRGGGTVTGGTLQNATVSVPLAADGTIDPADVLTIGSSVSGRLVFTLTCAAPPASPYPQGLVVARWTGTKPDVSKLRLNVEGDGKIRAKFAANDNGAITADLMVPGLILIFR